MRQRDLLRCAHLTSQHEDGVDVRQDAVEAEVDVRTHEGKHRGQAAAPRLKLGEKEWPWLLQAHVDISLPLYYLLKVVSLKTNGFRLR